MIVPCIDLMDGKVVQLKHGRELMVERDDLDAIIEWFAPFPLIHIIDLNAAIGNGSNQDQVEYILKKRPARVGGGVRTVERAAQLMERGAAQVIVGSSAFTATGLNHDFLSELVKSIGQAKICVALDTLDGKVVVKGWRESTDLSALILLPELEQFCHTLLCTTVENEGAMQGTNAAWFAELRAGTNLKIIAAGGVSTLTEARKLEGIGVDVVLGMALYTGAISVEEILN